jgi:hypothetical protein
MRVLTYIFLVLALCANAQDKQSESNSDSKTNLPKLTSKQRFQQLVFTTPAYRSEALRLVIQEANKVAEELNLLEQLPIMETNLVAAYIPPPKMAQRLGGALGNVTTSNYTYYVSIANKFCFLEQDHLEQGYDKLRMQYLWPISRMNTNEAYQLATQWLAAASMDVKGITRDCDVHIDAFTPEGKNGKHFVPVYWVYWTGRERQARGTVAEVEFVEPTKTIRKLRVNRPEYILRPSLQITNLDYLLSQTNTPAGE